jgi:peptidoglycan/xylan/chitin deacetylase (PgdA/CDA1 family)
MTSVPARDFRGYGGRPPNIRWPGEARVAVSLVVNMEEGAELSVSDGDERNEGAYEAVEEVEGYPDLCQDSHFEYGTRAGWRRVATVLAESGAVATLNACGRAVERSPWLAAEAAALGHEVCCHGWRWERHAGMSEAVERRAIAKTVAAIREAAGVTPVGWHTRSAPSVNTRRLLMEHGGFIYDSDAYCDDLPFFVEVAGQRRLVLPYAFDTNDMNFFRAHRFVSGDDFASYVIAAFDRLWLEGASAPRMLSIGLHLRMIGRPGRIGGLETILRHIQDRGGAWIARRDSIARHWLASAEAAAQECEASYS